MKITEIINGLTSKLTSDPTKYAKDKEFVESLKKLSAAIDYIIYKSKYNSKYDDNDNTR